MKRSKRNRQRRRMRKGGMTLFPKMVFLFALLIAVFGVYQFWSVGVQNKGLEASAIGAALGAPEHVDATTSTKDKDKDSSSGRLIGFDTEPVGERPSSSAAGSTSSEESVITDASDEVDEEEKQGPVTFANVELIGKAAIVIDTRSGEVLFQKNSQMQLPLASITKVMAAIAANSLFEDDDSILITQEAKDVEGTSPYEVGGVWSFKNLLDYSLVTSSNDGITAIALGAEKKMGEKNALIHMMNKKAKDLGLDSMFYADPTGLDLNASMSGGYGSAASVSALFQYVYKKEPALLEATTHKTVHVTNKLGEEFIGENTDELVDQIPNMLASKTGFTDLAGGNLAITWNAGLNRPVTAVVLGSTWQGRFDDMQKLVEATQNSF